MLLSSLSLLVEFIAYWLQDPSFLLVVSCGSTQLLETTPTSLRLSAVSFHVGFLNKSAYFIKPARRVSASKTETYVM